MATVAYVILAVLGALAGIFFYTVIQPAIKRKGPVQQAAYIQYQAVIDDPGVGVAQVSHTEIIDAEHTRFYFDNGEARTYRRGDLEPERWDEPVARRNRRIIYRFRERGAPEAQRDGWTKYLDTPSDEAELRRLRDDAQDHIAVELQRAREVGDIARPVRPNRANDGAP